MTGAFQPVGGSAMDSKADAGAGREAASRETAGWPVSLPVIPSGPWRDEYPFASKWLPMGNGLAMHYVDEGQGPPVVMVHGNPAWSFMFRRLISDLAGYRRVAMDHLGMGLSSRSDEDYRLSDRIRDLGRLMERLNLTEPVHLVAHDWGGPIAIGWAADRPEMVASLTLMNTGLAAPSGWKIPRKLRLFQGASLMSRIFQVDVNLFVGGLIRLGTLRPLTKSAESGFRAPYSIAAHRRAIGAFIRDIPISPKHPSWPALKRAKEGLKLLEKKPVLLPWGMRDFVFSGAFLSDFKRWLPDAEALPLNLAGHWLLEDEPEKILEALRAHLDKASGKAPIGEATASKEAGLDPKEA